MAQVRLCTAARSYMYSSSRPPLGLLLPDNVILMVSNEPMRMHHEHIDLA